MDSTTQNFDGILSTVLSTLDSSVETIEILEKEKQGLIQKLAEAEKVTLQKVASAKQIFKDEDLDICLNKLTDLGIIPPGYQNKVAKHLKDHPESTLKFIDQLTESFTAPHSEGRGIDNSNNTLVESDQDGWSDYVAGRPVKVRK